MSFSQWYRNYLQASLKKVGLNDTIVYMYHKYKLATTGCRSININNTIVEFEIKNRDDYIWLSPANQTSSAEFRIAERIVQESKSGDVFLDIGANDGIYSCIFAKCIPKSTVISVEPHPTNIEKLERNADRNAVSVHPIKMAFSNSNEIKELYIGANPRRHTLESGENNEAIKVPVRTGDKILADEGYPTPDVIKIDVEGVEKQVLQGLEQTLKEGCRLIVCEVHEPAEADDIRSFLKNKGFKVSDLNLDRVQTHLIGKK